MTFGHFTNMPLVKWPKVHNLNLACVEFLLEYLTHFHIFLFLHLFQLAAETSIEVVWFIEVEVVLSTDDQKCY